MDVVKNNINKLGGTITIESNPGLGTMISIALPLTLAILDGLNISVGDARFILPLASIVESLQPEPDMIKHLGSSSDEYLLLRDEMIPIVRLHKIFGLKPVYQELTQGMLIIVRAGNGKISLFVDAFFNQQQVVIKPIDKNFRAVPGISGATVRGDGSVGLIIDVLGVQNLHKSQGKAVA